MSESVGAGASVGSTGAASAQTSAPTQSTTQSSGGMSAQTTGGNPNSSHETANAGAAQGQGETSPKPQPKKLADTDLDAIVTIKVNGQTKDVTVREAIKLQQLEAASHEKLRLAAEREKKAQSILERMEKDFEGLMRERGQDPDEWAEKLLAKKYEMMQMSPEERELHQLRAEKEAQMMAEMSSKKEILDQIRELGAEIPPGVEKLPKEQLLRALEHQKMVYQETQKSLEKEIIEAWQASGLPKHKYFGALMSFHMMNHQKRSGEPLQAAQAAAMVKEDFGNSVREIFSNMDAQAIQEFLGQELLQKLRDYDVQRVTGKAVSSIEQNGQRPEGHSASGQPKKYLNQMEWRKAMGIA